MASSKGCVGRFWSRFRLTLSEQLRHGFPFLQTSLDTNDELNEMRALNRTVTSKQNVSVPERSWFGGGVDGWVSLASVTMTTCLLQEPFFLLTLDCLKSIILHFKVTPRVAYACSNPICDVAACNLVGLDENKIDLREKGILHVV